MFWSFVLCSVVIYFFPKSNSERIVDQMILSLATLIIDTENIIANFLLLMYYKRTHYMCLFLYIPDCDNQRAHIVTEIITCEVFCVVHIFQE